MIVKIEVNSPAILHLAPKTKENMEGANMENTIIGMIKKIAVRKTIFLKKERIAVDFSVINSRILAAYTWAMDWPINKKGIRNILSAKLKYPNTLYPKKPPQKKLGKYIPAEFNNVPGVL